MSDSETGFWRSSLTRTVSSSIRLYDYLRGPSRSEPQPEPRVRPQASAFSPPSPLTYLTSSYLVLSLSLAFLLHRIHHLVPPSNRPFHHEQRHAQLERVNSPLVQIGVRLPGILYMLKSSAALFLAALSPTTAAPWVHPEHHTWRNLGLRALQASTRFCGKGQLGTYLATGAVTVDHSSLLWQTFLSISTSITCETFVRSLSDDSPSLHSFNLLSFSFLLHVQSHPASSSSSDTSQDNYELYLYLLLTLLELISLQLSYLVPYFLAPFQRRPSRPHLFHPHATVSTAKQYRFPITLFYSLVSQFLALRSYHLFYHQLTTPLPSPPPLRATDSALVERYSTEGGGGGGGALIWFNKLPEIGFEFMVVASLGIKTLAAVIRGEELSRENLVGAPIHWDSTEDYAVVLIKYTTALLRATRLSTLSYELSPLSVLPSSIATSLESIGFDLTSTSSSSSIEEEEALNGEGGGGLRVRLERNGDVVLMEELEKDSRTGQLRRRTGGGGGRKKSEALEYGFGVEVKKVEVEPLAESRGGGGGFDAGGGEWDGEWGTGFDQGGVEYGRREGDIGMGLVQGERRGWIWRFTAVVLRILFYLGYVSIVFVTTTIRRGLRLVGLRSLEGRLKDTWTTRERERNRARSRSVGIDRTANAEDEDEEDEDWRPSEEHDASSSSSDEEDDGNDPNEGTEGEGDENALTLISDLSQSLENESLTPTELAPYLLAHHLSPASSSTQSPLTRRRYQSLLPPSFSSTSGRNSPPTPPEDLSSLAQLDSAVSSSIRSRSTLLNMSSEERERKREEWRESRSSFCVVCTVEPRTIILWPCRCLVLCESCRDALALRTTASAPGGNGEAAAGTGGSLCPTCRVGVAGFSRIYIP